MNAYKRKFQAQQVGIINEDYKYIIANLDFHAFDLEEYKYTEANITSFRLFSPEQKPIQEIMEKMGHKSSSEDLRNGKLNISGLIFAQFTSKCWIND